jgi:hypothetical protein
MRPSWYVVSTLSAYHPLVSCVMSNRVDDVAGEVNGDLCEVEDVVPAHRTGAKYQGKRGERLFLAVPPPSWEVTR